MTRRTITILTCDKCKQDIKQGDYLDDDTVCLHASCFPYISALELYTMQAKARTSMYDMLLWEVGNDTAKNTLHELLLLDGYFKPPGL